MNDKVELIRQISQFHPAREAGLKRGWSHYVGGMADTGDWYFWKMYDGASMEELQQCLVELNKESEPPPPLSEEDKAKQKMMIRLPGGIVTNQLEYEKLETMHKDLQSHLLWGLGNDLKQDL